MVLYKVKFEKEKVDEKCHKLAQKRLSGSLPKKDEAESKLLTRNEFLKFKRMLELYLKTLKLRVESGTEPESSETQEDPISVSLNDFCRQRNVRPLDILVDKFDPANIPADVNTCVKEYVVLSHKVDEVVADDILGLQPPDIDYLSAVTGTHRTCNIVRKLGESFYLSLDSYRQLAYNTLLDMHWKEEEAIMDFNHRFQVNVSTCNELNLYHHPLDQMFLYMKKLRENRSDNQVMLTARSMIRSTETINLAEVMKRIASVILNNNSSGIIPFDLAGEVNMVRSHQFRPPQFRPMLKRPSNNASRSSFYQRQNGCYYCGEMVTNFMKHFNSCKAKTSVCGRCGRSGHLASVCEKYKRQRQETYKKRKLRMRREQPQGRDQVNLTTSSAPLHHSNYNEFQGSLFLTTTEMEKGDKIQAVVDTGASCVVMTDLRFFETLDTGKCGKLRLLDKSTDCQGVGIVRIQFKGSHETFRFPAYYVAEGSLNVLSNKVLHEAGIVANHAPDSSCLQLPAGDTVALNLSNGISLVELQPPVHPVVASALTMRADVTLWHRRTMHMAEGKLRGMKVLRPGEQLEFCDVCAANKPKFKKLKTDIQFKDVPTMRGELVAIDVMMPARAHTGAMLLAIDLYSRFVVGEYVIDLKAPTLFSSLKKLLNGFKNTPKRLLLDRQQGLMVQQVRSWLIDQNIHFKFATPGRHSELNSVVERTIQSLRAMSRCALEDAQLTSSFWRHAVFYAVYVKNMLPHDALGEKTPFEVYFGIKPKYDSLRVFGSLCYQLTPIESRRNKFLPITKPRIFLGYDSNSSFDTAVLYNPETKRINYRHIQDVYFNERLTFAAFKRNQSHRPAFETTPTIAKHEQFLCETSSSESDVESENNHETELEHQQAMQSNGPTAATERSSQANSTVTSPATGANVPIRSHTRSDRNTHLDPNPTTRTPYRTKSGRVVRLPSYLRETLGSDRVADSIYAIVTTSHSRLHVKKPVTERQREKLKQRILKSRQEQKPFSFQDLKNAPDKEHYLKAIEKEFNVMHERKVLETIHRSTMPDGAELGSLILLLTRKRDGRYKARLVYNGKAQKYKIGEYHSSPTLRHEALCCALAIAAQRGYSFLSMDITSAFLYASLPANVQLYTHIPQGHPDYPKRDSHLIKVKKNLYGLKEAPLLWWKHLEQTLTKKLSLKQCIYEECMFTGQDLIMLVYVDDILLLGEKQQIRQLHRKLSKQFKLTATSLNQETDFLGCMIERNEEGIFFLSQTKYIHKILTNYAKNVRPRQTPLPVSINWDNEELDDSNYKFEECLGALGYLRLSRLDLLHAIHILSKQNKQEIKVASVVAMNHCLGYLKKTANFKRQFFPSKPTNRGEHKLVAFVDAALGSDPKTRKSTGGSFVFYNQSLIGATSSTQQRVCTSSAESELTEIYRTSKKMLYYKGLLNDVGETEVESVILTDSKASVHTVNMPVSTRYKFLSLYIHFVKQLLRQLQLKVVFVRRELNPADLLTKQNCRREFDRLWTMLLSPFRWVHVQTETVSQKRKRTE